MDDLKLNETAFDRSKGEQVKMDIWFDESQT
jgi:hypothetical protein